METQEMMIGLIKKARNLVKKDNNYSFDVISQEMYSKETYHIDISYKLTLASIVCTILIDGENYTSFSTSVKEFRQINAIFMPRMDKEQINNRKKVSLKIKNALAL